MSITWKGVMPATVTQFNADMTIDHALMAEHGKWLVEGGCSAIVVHGSHPNPHFVVAEILAACIIHHDSGPDEVDHGR